MTAKKIIKILNKKYPKKHIIGIRGLIKSGENEFSFRYVYRVGDYLSISDTMFINSKITDFNKIRKTTKTKVAH
jgi:hypothetical protein